MFNFFRKRKKAITNPSDADNRSGGSPASDPTAEKPSTSSKKPRPILGWIQIVLVLGAVLIMLVITRGGGDTTGRPAGPPGSFGAGAPDSRALPVVQTVEPELRASQVTLDATGTVNVRSYVELSTQVTGRVVSVSPALRPGGSFGDGEVLLTIERRDFELALDQAKADVAAAQSQVLLAQAEGDAARKNYALLNPGKPVPPLVAKLPQIAQGRAQLQAAQARQDIAALDLSRTEFALPFSGRVTETSAEIGQMVSSGQSFGQAFSVESLEVTVPISQVDLSRIEPVEGRSVVVSSDERMFMALVERVSAELDGRTRFAKLFLSLASETTITPGAFVDVVVQGPTIEKTFVLPEAAEQGGGYIWWVNEGALVQHNPKILARTGSDLIIEAFDAGQGVVVGPVPGAFEGLKVKMAIDS